MINMKLILYSVWIFSFFDVSWTFQEGNTLLKLLESGEKNLGVPTPESILVFGSSEDDTNALVQILTSQHHSTYDSSFQKSETNSTKSFPRFLPPGDLDMESSITFYNLPVAGAFNFGNKSIEIASAFFVSKLVENISRVKLLLVTQVSVFRNPKRYAEFNRMLQRTSVLLEDIDMFFDSIALIVINDDDTLNSPHQLITEVVEKVSELCERAPDQYKTFTEKFNRMISRTDGNGNFTRIAAINPYAPTESEIEDVQQVIYKELDFRALKERDFNVRTSKSSRDSIQAILSTIDSQLSQVMAEIAAQVKLSYKSQLQSNQFLLVYHKLKMLHKFLSEVLNPALLKLSTEPRLSYKRITKGFKALEEFGIQLSNEQIEKISHSLEYIYRLRKIGNLKDEANLQTWDTPLKTSFEYIHNLFTHYSCLHDLYGDLMTLRIQGLREEIVKGTGTLPFENLIKQFGIHTELKCLEENPIPDIVKRSVLKYTMESPVHYECVGDMKNHLRVFGDFISLVNVNRSFCSSSVGEIQILEVFGWNKIFIDAPHEKFRVLGMHKLVLISPSVEIRPGSELDLSGRHGEAYKGRAQDGNDLSRRGTDGLQGKPGESGGSVLILTGSIISTKSSKSGRLLQITSNGGDGGTGQNGGNGGPGVDGVMAKEPTVDEEITKQNGFSITQGSGRSEIFLKKSGSKGIQGGNGGDGGHGGPSGSGGEVQVVIVGQDNNRISKQIEIMSSNGKQGSCGQGGSGGLGGLNGLSLLNKNKWGCTFVPGAQCKKSFRDHPWVTFLGLKEGRGPSGSPGKCANPTTNEFIHAMSLQSDSIAEYKRIARSQLPSEFRKSVLKPFLSTLETTSNITKYYSVFGLIKEFNFLNEHFNNQNYNSFHAWKYFSNLVLKFPLSFYNAIDSDAKIVAEYLYTASLSKLLTLQDHFEKIPSQVITDVREYLEAVKSDIEGLKNLRKSQMVRQQRDKYFQETKENIEEANEFIKQLEPALNTLKLQISNSMDDLIEEIFNLQKQTQVNHDQLKAAKKKLAYDFLLQKIFSAVNFVGNGLMLLGPKGFAVGVVINGVSSLVHNSIAHKDVSTPRPINFPGGMTSNYIAQIKSDEASENEILEFNQTISDIHGELEVFKNINEVSSVIITIESIRRRIVASKISKNQFQAYKEEVDNQIQTSESKIQQSTTNPKSSSKLQNAFAALKKCRKLYSFYKRFRKEYRKLRKTEKLSVAIDSVDEQLSDYDSKLQQIQEYHSILQENINPQVSQTVGNIIQTGNMNQSLVGLDKSKWNIQTTLRNLKSQLESLSQGTDASNDLLRCMERLEDTMTIVIHIYQRIQAFNEQIRLADFIAKIETEETLLIKDARLRETVEDIDLSIRSNLIIMEYQTIIHSMKQWTFPFAHLFIENLENLDTQVSETSSNASALTYLTHSASRNIMKLQKTVSKTRASIFPSQDRIEFIGKFDDKMPFFIWNNQEYSTSIRDLLAGKEAAFYADVKKSPKTLDAIRFTSVQILLRAKNETMQRNVDYLLQDFQFRMSHLGRSYYRFEDKFYVIPSSNLTLVYSSRSDQSGNPITTNTVYRKLQQGNPILSPYAMWSFKIEPVHTGSFVNVSTFDYLLDNIDIILAGNGVYIQRQPFEANLSKRLELDRYYNQVQL